MSSRQEEKERKRQERRAREESEKAKAARRRRLQMVFGAVLVVLILGAGAAFAVMSMEDDGGGEQVASGDTTIPPRQETDLKKAADAAGCTLVKADNEGAGHEEKEYTAADYKQNPPTSGTHFPTWYDDGIYAPGDTPELGRLVHTLEHGRIDIQYKKGTDATTVAQLETLYNEMDGGYHMLLFENGTDMPFAVAASAWDNYLGCTTMNPKVFDAIRAFRDEHIDKGPEVVP